MQLYIARSYDWETRTSPCQCILNGGFCGVDPDIHEASDEDSQLALGAFLSLPDPGSYCLASMPSSAIPLLVVKKLGHGYDWDSDYMEDDMDYPPNAIDIPEFQEQDDDGL